eukprot:TRINITY_DN9934_c0_g1_i1.p1 TRINITY_DN9934_c0_g1~~TRINITY_DN9934_c0_g1_i1.p1  ORF type:complete len:327 (+),score=93.08 TRINITY_DN9934_c0_g1_i1:69-1049(+)
MEALKKLLDTPVGDVTTRFITGAVICIGASETVAAACELLHKSGVSSAVVYDFHKRAMLGMIDMLDIVSHLAATFPSDTELTENFGKAIDITSFVFSQEPIKFVINKHQVDTFVPVPTEWRLLSALEPMANAGLHRLPIVEANDDHSSWATSGHEPVVKVLSQSAVLAFLHEHRAELVAGNSFFNEKLSSFKSELLNNTPLIVDTKIRAIDAVRLIDATKRNALVIVDNNNSPIRNFSANDLKRITSADIPNLLLPLPEFIDKLSGKSEAPAQGLVWCTMDTSLIDAIDLIVKHRIHRLWVFGPDGKTVVAVLSLTSILKEILNHL